MNERPAELQSLRAIIGDELKPARPLAAPWVRLLYIAPIAVAAMIMPYLYHQIRDLGTIGMLLAWVPITIQLLLAHGLLFLALREGIPGWRPSQRAIGALCLAAFTIQIVVNYLIFLRAPMGGLGASFSMWMACFRTETLIGVPILLGIVWLVSRTLPQRPMLAGFLVGTGAGMAADSSWRLFCPYSAPTHVLLGHTGGILILGLTGFLLGYLWTLHARREELGRTA